MGYWHIDAGGVSIIFGEGEVSSLRRYLPDFDKLTQYEGWVNEGAAITNKVGFYISHISHEGTIFGPDFHNVPFFYKDDFDGYMGVLVKHVRESGLPDWQGHRGALDWSDLGLFVRCLRTAPLP